MFQTFSGILLYKFQQSHAKIKDFFRQSATIEILIDYRDVKTRHLELA